VLNADDDFFDSLKARSPARVVSFGQSEAAHVRVEDIVLGPEGRVSLRLRGWWGKQEIALGAAGRHHAMNAAAAAAAAMTAGAEPAWLVAGLSAFEAADMRGQILTAPGGYTVINDTYNAAPDSMRVALELLADLPGERKWAALGDMKELGPMGPEWHREVGELAAALGLAGLVTVGELAHHIAAGARAGLLRGEVIEAADNAAAAQAIAERVRSGDVVLVKGSRAMKMDEIVGSLLRGAGQGADD